VLRGDDPGLLVRPETARQQIDQELTPPVPIPEGTGDTKPDGPTRPNPLKAKELVLREKELVVEEGSLQRNHDYALKALEAQTKDRDADQGFRQKAIFWSFLFEGFLTVLLAAFCSYALYFEKD
jgi:hypothetical protein